MSKYLEKVNKFVFQIKDNVERTGFATPYTVNQLLTLYLDNVQYSIELEKKLEYALKTKGKYLEINKIVN